jgi:hypothetical protein
MSDDLTPDDLTPDDLTPDHQAPGDLTPSAAGEAPDRAPDSDRDQELAAVLAVAPLDDVSRRRLVRTALAERRRTTRPVGRLAAGLGIAAALVIGVVIGSLVVTRPDDPEPTTAARAPASSPAPSSPAPSADAGVPALAPAATPLGDLGALDSARALRDAITARLEDGEDPAAESSIAGSCLARGPETVGLVVISAFGTATLDAAPAVVLVGPTPSGKNLALALDPASCAVLETVTLRN